MFRVHGGSPGHLRPHNRWVQLVLQTHPKHIATNWKSDKIKCQAFHQYCHKQNNVVREFEVCKTNWLDVKGLCSTDGLCLSLLVGGDVHKHILLMNYSKIIRSALASAPFGAGSRLQRKV